MKFSMSCILALASFGLFQTAAHAADYYGAIYYSNSGAYGYAYNYTTQEIAEAVAFKNCAAYANDCYEAIWTVNGCAALARASNNAAGWAWTTSADSAKVNALTNCSSRGTNCTVVASFCTGNRSAEEDNEFGTNGFLNPE